MGHKLYAGRCGVALFLAGLDHVTGRATYRGDAEAALNPLQRILVSPSARRDLGRRLGLGAGSGIGGMLYALAWISKFVNAPCYLEAAEQLADFITPEKIGKDDALDVLSGAAGGILGVLALHQSCPEKALLGRAIACGEHLLRSRVMNSSGRLVWLSPLGVRPLTGFSHGAAGISLALIRLFDLTGDERFLEAGQNGIDYESAVYSPQAGNWPDFRRHDSEDENSLRFMTTWCHGAPGIGLARLGMCSVLRSDRIIGDIQAALETSSKHGMSGPDHLCCGNMGRIELLAVAGRQLNRPELYQEALQAASWVVARQERVGGYSLHAALTDTVYNASFFQGMAGIGYQLLRLVSPERVPSVLLWE